MIFNSTMSNALAKATVAPRWFMWIKAKNRTSGAVEQSGLWNGLTDMTLTVDGDLRTYRGAGGLIGLDSLSYTAGTEIGSQKVTVSLADPKVVELIRVYDARFASVDIHLGLIDPETEALLGQTLAFRGIIDRLDISDDLTASLDLVSALRHGSKSLTLKQSDADQRKIDSNDRGREYASISSAVKTFWGSKSE